MKRLIPSAVVSCALAFASFANAQAPNSVSGSTGNTNSSTLKKVDLPKPAAPKTGFSFVLDTEYDHSAIDYHNGNRQDALGHLAKATYKLANGTTVAMGFIYVTDYVNPDASGISDLKFTWGKLAKWETRIGHFTPAVFVYTPAAKASIEKTELVAGPGARLQFDMADGLLGKYLSVNYMFDYFHNIYRDNLAKTASTRPENEVRQYLTPSLNFDKWSLGFAFWYFTKWDRDGYMTGIFQNQQSLDYAINDNVTVGVLHGLGGTLFKDDGPSNSRIWDEEQSYVGAHMTLTY